MVKRRYIVSIFKWLIALLVAFVILFPMYWIFISSITPPGELFKSPIDYLPDHPTLDSYKFLIQNVGLLEKIGNTLIIVGSSIILSTIICVLAAYAFARFANKIIRRSFGFIVITMLIPEIVMARSLYEFIRSVGLFDTYLGLILLYTSSVIPFSTIILTKSKNTSKFPMLITRNIYHNYHFHLHTSTQISYFQANML